MSSLRDLPMPEPADCWCRATVLPSPAGDIVVLRIGGEIDLATIGDVQAALRRVLMRRPDHLVVDLAGVTFCGSAGLALLVDTALTTADRNVRYALSGASPQAERLWELEWSAEQLPPRHRSARDAVLAAMAGQVTRADRVRPRPPVGRPPRRLSAVPDLGTDQLLGERARAGDVDAYRTLVRRHRADMYRDALRKLGAAGDPVDITEDLAGRLRHALALFARADPT